MWYAWAGVETVHDVARLAHLLTNFNAGVLLSQCAVLTPHWVVRGPAGRFRRCAPYRHRPTTAPSKPIQAHRPSNRDLYGRFWPLWETPDFPSKRALDGLVGPTRSSDSHTERAVEPLLSSSSEAVQQHHRLIGPAWFSARSRPYLTVAPVSAAPGKHCRPP